MDERNDDKFLFSLMKIGYFFLKVIVVDWLAAARSGSNLVRTEYAPFCED